MTTRMQIRPGRRLSISDLRFDVFPPGEDPWWIRWFDYDGEGGGVTGTAMIRVVLSRLPSGVDLDHPPVLDGALAASSGEQASARLQAGWLPVISIGLIVRAGAIIGRLGSVVRRFAFGASAHRQYLEHLLPPSDPGPVTTRPLPRFVPKPEGRPRPPGEPPEGLMPDLLGQTPYPLRVADGRLLSIRGRRPGAAHLLLPCPEVFRVMYAPHRALAIALLGGSWSGIAARRVLDPDLTGFVDDGEDEPHWSVATVGGLGVAHAAVAGNLWINRWGRACADRLWKSLAPGVGRQGVIAATLPFRWDALEIGAACIELPAMGNIAARTFGYAITGVRWPDPPCGPPSEIDWIPGWRPRSTVTDGEAEKPGRPVGSTVPEVGTPLDAVQGEDPADGPGVDVFGDGPAWTNAPEVVKVEREPGPPGTKRRVMRRDTPRVSAGSDGGRGGGAAPVKPQAGDPFGGRGLACDRFERVVAMLDGLVVAGSIVSHAEVVPPKGRAAARGTRSTWVFPDTPLVSAKGTERWYLRDFAKRVPETTAVRRTAMIRSIVTEDGMLHLVEIEPRSSAESFQSLLFEQASDARLEAVISRLLAVAVAARGVWRNALRTLAASGNAAGIARQAVSRHATLAGDMNGDPLRRPLNGARFLIAMGSLAPFDDDRASGGGGVGPDSA